MTGLIKTWPDGAGAHPSRMADIEALLGQLSNVAAAAYGTTIASDSSVASHYTVTATDTSAFTISAPSNAKKGHTLTFDILNSSGGSLGTVTWNAVFKLAGAFTNPADGKRRTITYRYTGTNWVETNRAAADI